MSRVDFRSLGVGEEKMVTSDSESRLAMTAAGDQSVDTNKSKTSE